MNKQSFIDRINKIFDFQQLNKIVKTDLLLKLDSGDLIYETVDQLKTYLKQLHNSDIEENKELEQFFQNVEYVRNYIKFPQIIQSNSANVFGFSLDYLKQLFIDEYLTERFIYERCMFGHNLDENELADLKLEFKASLGQAIEYLNNSVKSDITIAPLLLYYSLINFINCYNLLKYEPVLKDKANRTHGIDYTLEQTNIFGTKLKFLPHSNLHVYLKENELSFDSDEYELLDALKSIYYLSDFLNRSKIDSNVLEVMDQHNDGLLASPCGAYPSRIAINMQQFSKLTGIEIKKENAIKVFDYLLPEFKELFKYNLLTMDEPYIDSSRLGFHVSVIDCCPQSIWQKNLVEFLSAHRDQNSTRFIIIENKTKINDPIVHIYAASFLFGSISRYHPKLWSQYISKPENKIFIERFIRSTAIFILYKFLTLFSREYILFK